MDVFSTINFKVFLIQLESYAIPHSASEQHLRAFHEVEHDVLQDGAQREFVYHVEVNLILCNHLYSYVAFLEIYLPLFFKCVVQYPLFAFLIIIELPLKE